MAQLVINVGAAPNDGLGDPIRTAYQKCNTNFSELFSRVQTSVPPTLVGSVGDTAGMYAYDSNYFYYCYADYDGSSVIWGKVADSVADYDNANVVTLLATFGSNTVSTTGNITSGNVLTSGIVSSTGNAIHGNILTSGLISATGNITGGNLKTAATLINTAVSTSGNVTGANLVTAGSISSTGNVQAGNVRTAGLVSATGNVNGGNIISAALVQGVTVSATGNVQAGNLRTTGLISSTGNIIGGADLYIGNGAATTTFTNPIIIGKDTGLTYVQGALVNSSGNGSADWVAYGNNGDDTQSWLDIGFTGNTFNDANYTITKAGDGYVFAQGNASFGGNLVLSTGNVGTTKDIIFATGGFLAANERMRYVNASNTFSVTGNVQSGNLRTTGLVSATGNITGNNVSSTTTMQLAVYANTTVRDSSIASPIPGMMIYVTGTGMQVRGATSWNTVAGTGT